jgi:UDP-N-acetylmuramyl pentapeptide phosphotransferase/UDP-N-acetylglucosamine-1-phosphate transferase
MTGVVVFQRSLADAPMTLLLIVVIMISVMSGLLGSMLIYKYGGHLSLTDVPSERSSHSTPTPRGGGIGIWVASLVVGFFVLKDVPFTMAAGVVGILGLVEDRFSLTSHLRLVIQFIVSSTAVLMVVLYSDTLLTTSLVLFPLWVLFVVGTTNFYNFMDGINGIAGLTGIVGFGLVAFFSFFIADNVTIAFMSIALSCACLGFLPLNFPRAKVFMGDVGSLLLGFMFAVFVVRLSTDLRVFLCLIMFLFTFYADALVTIFYRWRRGENLMEAHRSHLYQHLCNTLGFPHWKISIVYMSIQLVIGVLAILAYKTGFHWQIVLFIVSGVVFLIGYTFVKNKVFA